MNNIQTTSSPGLQNLSKATKAIDALGKLESTLPNRYQNMTAVKARTSDIMVSLKARIEDTQTKYKSLLSQIDEAERKRDYTLSTRLCSQDRNRMDKTVEQIVDVCQKVLGEFEALKKTLDIQSEEITKAEMQEVKATTLQVRTVTARGGRRNQGRVARAPIIGETPTTTTTTTVTTTATPSDKQSFQKLSEEFGKTIDTTLSSIESLMSKITLPSAGKSTKALPLIRIEIIPRNQLNRTRGDQNSVYQLDATGIARAFKVSNVKQAYSCAYEHMTKRLSTIKMICNEIGLHAMDFNEKHLQVNQRCTAMTVYRASETASMPYYQEAHISPLPQIQMVTERESQANNLNHVRIFNPLISLKTYFYKTKAETAHLDQVLNATDYAPPYINNIDGISETFDRPEIVSGLNNVIHGSDPSLVFNRIVSDIKGTLIVLKTNLEAGEARRVQYKASLKAPTEDQLYKDYYFSADKVIAALNGMLSAIEYRQKVKA